MAGPSTSSPPANGGSKPARVRKRWSGGTDGVFGGLAHMALAVEQAADGREADAQVVACQADDRGGEHVDYILSLPKTGIVR